MYVHNNILHFIFYLNIIILKFYFKLLSIYIYSISHNVQCFSAPIRSSFYFIYHITLEIIFFYIYIIVLEPLIHVLSKTCTR